MKLQTKLALTLVAGSLLLGAPSTVFGAEENTIQKPLPAAAVDVQTPELQKADQRVEDAKAQLDLARKQLRASQALLKAAEADLRAADTDRKAIALKHQAQNLAADAQLPMAPAAAKTKVAAKPAGSKGIEETTTTTTTVNTVGTPIPGTEVQVTQTQVTDFNGAQPVESEQVPVVAPTPSTDVPQLR